MKTKLAVLAVAALVMWGLKRHYADAPVDDLRWMLEPTARLVTILTGVPFEREAGEGYVSRERLFVIAKACAGINFMIAAFGMVAWTLRRRVRSVVSGAGVFLASLGASYAAAVVVNAMRIAAALWLAEHPIRTARMTAAQLHRVEGIVFYFSGLVLLGALVQWCDRPSQSVKLATPLVFYYGVAILIPLANGAAGNGAAFVAHAVAVLVMPAVLVALVAGGREWTRAFGRFLTASAGSRESPACPASTRR